MTDVNADFQRYRNFFTSAAAAQQAGNYTLASEQFGEALQLARQYSPRSTDEASCLQGLAESYFGCYKFPESKATFQELEQLIESWGETVSERRFNISLQLARCHLKMHEFDQACAIYAKGLDMAEVALRYGDQKMTSILESYANALRLARKDPQKLAEIEQKARLSLSRQSNPQFLSVIAAKETGRSSRPEQGRPDTPSSRNRKSQTGGAQEVPPEKSKIAVLQEKAKDHPRIAMACMCVLVIGFLQFLFLIAAINDIKGTNPPPASSPAAIGNTYYSADGKETLKFMERGKVQINGAAGLTNARCYVASPGWSEFIAVMVMQKSNQIWLVPNAQGLKDPRGNKQLYDLKAYPIIDLAPRLNAIAKGCQLFITRFKKYPGHDDLLGTVPNLSEKLSDGQEYLPVFKEGDREEMLKDLHKFIDNRTIDLVHEKLAASKIVCITMPALHISPAPPVLHKIIIVPTDSTGTPFKSQQGVQLAIAVSDGELLPSEGLSSKIIFFSQLPKSVVISASSPDFIRHLYLDFLYVFCGASVMAYIAYKIKSLSVATSRGEPLSHKVKVLSWLVWSILIIVLLYRLEETCSAFLFRG